MAFDQFLKGLSAFNPNGSLSMPDANRIYDSYKAAGGGGPVNIVGAGGGGFGGLIGNMQKMMGGGASAGPGTPSPAFKPGLPQGGILGLLRGQSPQGLIGMLQGMNKAPIAGNMPQVGMANTGMPGSSFEGPVPPGLPMNIDPTSQF